MNIYYNRKRESKLFVEKEEFLKLCKSNGKVFIYKQNELLEEPKYALCFEETEFWIGCFKTKKAAKLKAETLGLKLIS